MSQQKSVQATVKAVDDAGSGGWTAVVSAPSVDRDDEVIEAGAFNPLPSTVPVHDKHFGELIGSGTPFYASDRLHVTGRFASTPKAQEIRSLVTEGHPTSMSVVFISLKDKHKDGRRHIVQGELLSVDWAPIPSNRDTRVLAVRSVARRNDLGLEAQRIATRAQLAITEMELDHIHRLDHAHARHILRDADRTLRRGREWRSTLADAEHLLAHLNRRPQ